LAREPISPFRHQTKEALPERAALTQGYWLVRTAGPRAFSAVRSVYRKSSEVDRDKLPMKKNSFCTIRALCFGLLLMCVARSPAATREVAIQNFAFVPETVTINVGDTVLWRNLDSDSHTSTSGTSPTPNGVWDSGNFGRNQTFSRTFGSAGTFPYFCRPHPFMTGRVIVQASAQPPTVSITAPANNSTFTAPANITIEATASVTGSTISSVEFFNGTSSLGTDTSSPYSISTTLPAGTHQITARATAANGTSTTSSPVTIVVNAPAQSPTISVTSPANNATFTAPATVTLEANASVSGSTISGVEFFNGTTSLGTDSSSPYSISTTLQAGTHQITARATAANGTSTTSSPITVIVNAPAQAPTVSITTPQNNASFRSPTNLTITATAAVNGATITMVEFFDGSNFLGMDHDSPFSITNNFAIGSHSLTAKATASNGLMATSAPVNVTITAAGTRIENPYPPIVKGSITIELQPVSTGLVSPLGLAAPNDGSGRLFVFDQVGMIHVLAGGGRLETPFLDVRSRLVPLQAGYDERGLLGLALHPNFVQNGLLYTYTSEPNGPPADFMLMHSGGETNNHQSVIAEWKIDAANTNRVDPGSRREIMRIDQPQANHNAGVMHFGNDGMLYIALGDGGAADDQGLGHSPGGNGQDLNNILGKIIRIDVNGRTSANGKYGVPAENPFVGKDGVDEIYAYGFRNPYSWSFDRQSGDMLVADVGQNDVEELDRITRGANYGWPIKEGTFFFDPNGDQDGFITTVPVREVPPDLVDPIAEYDHSEGLAIVGGYVYRGTNISGLSGRYVTGDFGRFNAPAGRLFFQDGSQFKELRIGQDDRALGLWLKGFGQDQQGELYALASSQLGPTGTGGRVLKIVGLSTNELAFTSITSGVASVTLTWSGGTPPFLLQKKGNLNDTNWMNLLTTANRAATVPRDGSAGFFRLVDNATGISVTPLSAFLSAAFERPSTNSSTATGLATFSLEGNTLSYDISYSGLTGVPTGAHIHGFTTTTNNAGVIVPFTPPAATSGRINGTVTLTDEQRTNLLAGRTYANIHTAGNGGGEIRGQILPINLRAALNGANERPTPVETPATGTGMFTLVGNELFVDVNYSGLKAVANNAHIHGPATVEGAAAVLIDMVPLHVGPLGTSGQFRGSRVLSPQHLPHLIDGLTYFNIHSGAHGGGEIRGQIIP
jgi:glucose/arabinose dehydrogenase/plastocyanin